MMEQEEWVLERDSNGTEMLHTRPTMYSFLRFHENINSRLSHCPSGLSGPRLLYLCPSFQFLQGLLLGFFSQHTPFLSSASPNLPPQLSELQIQRDNCLWCTWVGEFYFPPYPRDPLAPPSSQKEPGCWPHLLNASSSPHSHCPGLSSPLGVL